MDADAVKRLYDEPYAAAYDERFLLAEWPKAGVDFEAQVLQGLLTLESRWLDVGCGTGYFLSLFPHVRRAGLDLSPAMVARARAANPDARITEGSFLDEHPDWDAAWSVVSCMWNAYAYVQSIWEVERLVANLARWTAPDGACFIPVADLEDLRHVDVPYEDHPDVWGGSIRLTSVSWTWDEPGTGKQHTHLVAPQAEHFVRLLSDDFARVAVLRYPPFRPGWIARKAVLATGRRPRGQTGPADVHRDPVATQSTEGSIEGPSLSPISDAGSVVLMRELLRRAHPSDARLWRAIGRRLRHRRP